ncbi:putative kinase-like protein [Lasius niger]|uniref:Putative kinase-like protein n=1 Tax=Lasius niger TaxID=67767 RepID=A0A0J7KMP1_LASNI|nr:putative kinase-like protein [Lasius niger]
MSNTAVQIKSCLETKTITDIVAESNNSIYKLLSFDEVKEVTRRALNDDDAAVIEYAIRPYSDGKIGFLGSHYRLSVRVTTRKGETVALPLFLKSIPYEVPEQADYVIKKGVFEHETKFYGVLMPLLREGYRGKPWAPICHKVRNDLIIFEELGCKGYSTRNKLFDETLVRAGLSALARLHAASLLAETRLDVPLNRLYPDTFVEKGFTRDETTRRWLEAGFDVAAVVAERQGHDPHLVRATCERIYDITVPSCTKMNVVSHGDLWGNNLMFNNDVPPNCLLVDYQLLRYSPLAHDVAQFLYLCTDRSFREARESAMLRHYYETLCEILNAHEAVRKPSWSEVVQGMEEQRLGAVITAALYFPTVLMDESFNVQIMNDSYVEYCFLNRKKFVLSIMEKDSVYERRIREAVVEFAELASRLDQLPKPS